MAATAVAPVLRVGCAMWAHPEWIGRYLPPSARRAPLRSYAQWCNAVEGNTTFYAVPSSAAVERWCEQAPPHFRFAFKLPRTITHDRRLRHISGELHRFLNSVEPLGERVGPIQIQLPPTFGPVDIAVLGSFVTQLPSGFEWVVELRHPQFFDGRDAHRRVDALLRTAGVGRVVLDTRPLYATPPESPAARDEQRTKPALPVVVDQVGTSPIVRLIGADSGEVTEQGLGAWVDLVVDWLGRGRQPYVFVHQPHNLDSPTLARRFHDAVAAAMPSLTSLPEPPPTTPPGEMPGQSALF